MLSDGTSFDPTSSGSASGGFYVGTINGVTTTIVCDDANDNISSPLSWTADVLNATQIASNLSSTLFGTGSPAIPPQMSVIGYAEVAYLMEDMFNPTTSQTARDAISTAVWAITSGVGDAGFVSTLADTYYLQATGLGYTSATATSALSLDGNLTLYTPIDSTTGLPSHAGVSQGILGRIRTRGWHNFSVPAAGRARLFRSYALQLKERTWKSGGLISLEGSKLTDSLFLSSSHPDRAQFSCVRSG